MEDDVSARLDVTMEDYRSALRHDKGCKVQDSLLLPALCRSAAEQQEGQMENDQVHAAKWTSMACIPLNFSTV